MRRIGSASETGQGRRRRGPCKHKGGDEMRVESFRSAEEAAQRLRRLGNERTVPRVVVLCGPSCSGKSTFAGKLPRSFRVISSDTVRERLRRRFTRSRPQREVWERFDRLKRQALSEGRNVVLDACHMSRRARWHSLQGPNAGHRKLCTVFDLPLRTVRARCRSEGRLPLREVARMWRAFQAAKPTPTQLRREGYDEAHFVRPSIGGPAARGGRRPSSRQPRCSKSPPSGGSPHHSRLRSSTAGAEGRTEMKGRRRRGKRR